MNVPLRLSYTPHPHTLPGLPVSPLELLLCLQDTTFEMERQRNKPVKYNRELVHKSVKAMQKVEEVCANSNHRS